MRLVSISFLLTFLMVCNPQSWGQRSCATDSVHAQMMGLAGYAEVFQNKVNLVNQAAESGAMDCATPLIIPVAVHFQNTGIPEACAIDMALDQIEILNQDFAAINPDISQWYAQQPSIWPDISNAESCIQFCLATSDHPAGFGLAEGDYAVTIDQTTGDFNSSWSGYLNFWVRDIGPLGYSPLGGNGNGDGVTCHPQAFSSISCGGNSLYGAYNLGRTITHEVGHYLLLNHPWGNGGCSSTDNVADTPVTSEPIFGCPSGQSIVNCTEPVLWPSYMDYCNDACLFMFSAGQVTRMENYVTSSLQNLLNNSVTACQDPCDTACGCTDPDACNYDAAAANDDGSCDYSCQGCTDSTACNYDPDATDDDGSCVFPTEGFPCDCNLDLDFNLTNAGTGVGDAEIVAATATSNVTSFSIELTYSDVSGGSWAGDLLLGICDPNGTCIEIGGYNMSYGYTDAGGWPAGWNSEAAGTYTATINVSSYGLTGAGDWSFEWINGWSSTTASATWVGSMTIEDLCPGVVGEDVEGCTDSTACNYNAAATLDDASCAYASGCDYCSGEVDGTGTIVDGDADDDSVCDENEIEGCQDPEACNYDDSATDPATCEYAAEGFDCDGNPSGGCPEDINGNGTVEVADVLLLLAEFGCTSNCSAADIDGDGAVSVSDILMLLAAFGEEC
ncbi:MAG: M43 family zinc metalloprotease [Bacteroidetes bacterium]|nr:M43 family zinc metalloprotease [Bacteroidota bacterium]MDA1336454.1 M43 family zinc metalloprotease [Bacteroidota bacterium]